MTDKPPCIIAPLTGLKDFQQRTVNYVFQKFYGDKQNRFLVADEVGLGKTMVARGIIAKAIEHLQDKVDRIDIIYICSNAAIAAQNIKRLNVSNETQFSHSTRLTFLPKQVRSLRKNRINFISLTPNTALDHTRSRGGHKEERAILYRILYDLPLAKGERRERLRMGLLNLLQATASRPGWCSAVNQLSVADIDRELAKDFRRKVLDDAELYDLLKEGCEYFADDDNETHYSELRYTLIGKLRSKLASVCLSALAPDLVILDEFQRFKALLDGDDEAALLAKALFEQPNVRVLLLSATPYKMFTLDQESEEDNHYADFIRTLQFLYNDDSQIKDIQQHLLDHRTALHASENAAETKNALEHALLQVMCRTERVTMTQKLDAMTKEVLQPAIITPTDLYHAVAVDGVAMEVQARDVLEYWKSMPYLFNFLKHYELRTLIDRALKSPSDTLRKLVKSAKPHLLTKARLERYQPLDAANPRMRMLFEDTLDKGMWQLLWMPPSLPYTTPNGVYANKDSLTKTLVFSAWSAVPNAIATVCSYEAERRMVGAAPQILHSQFKKKVKSLLNFAKSSKDGRLTGMPVIAWMLPSPTLARHIDPLEIAIQNPGEPLSVKALRAISTAKCEALLETLPNGGPGSRADERWYWAAPALLDARTETPDWWLGEHDWYTGPSQNEPAENFREHIDQFAEVAQGKLSLGPRPDDLAEVLCDFALASPGTCALRALSRIDTGLTTDSVEILSAAAQIASGFRSLYNQAESISLLRGTGDDTYWRLTLRYGIDGNIQAMLDEYVHTLLESMGLQHESAEEQLAAIASRIQAVVSLRTTQLNVDELKTKGGNYTWSDLYTRCRFALRYGQLRDETDQAVAHAESVKDAFNSPFHPFVLASTSIGQEGLDFHTWCHAVMHWNLPSNPVDMEQREGRVHRYKGHAVRKNIAEHYGLSALHSLAESADPWTQLFALAASQRKAGLSDLIPYWIFEEGTSRVERRVPILPYSKESVKFKRLKRELALYRIVFGQPRQEDLLFGLKHSGDGSLTDLAQWLISLEPPKV
ncbi:helicase-related protein [Pantoea agglomerans]|uniref:helicase-related protein n=1 Tax=Enterobacter agglomerans TaxID=549 RepID=UPI00077FF0D1|nr:helicase-related protein [Pantoea agglomerans]KYM74022.1 helicase [Pantoea agglomerans]